MTEAETGEEEDEDAIPEEEQEENADEDEELREGIFFISFWKVTSFWFRNSLRVISVLTLKEQIQVNERRSH